MYCTVLDRCRRFTGVWINHWLLSALHGLISEREKRQQEIGESVCVCVCVNAVLYRQANARIVPYHLAICLFSM